MSLLLCPGPSLIPSSQEVAQIASCLGNRFDVATIATTAQITPEEVELRLVECIDAGFITEVRSERLSPEFYGSKSKSPVLSYNEFSTNKIFKYAEEETEKEGRKNNRREGR